VCIGIIMILGIDPTTSEKKPTACALLNPDGSFAQMAMLRTDAEILDLARLSQPTIVAIDSPLGFPKGMCCLEESCDCQSVHSFKGRVCERELLARGINLYITTKRTFIKPMIYRAIELSKRFKSYGCDVIEVYPFASKVMLFGRPIPPKSKREGIEFLRERLDERIPGLKSETGRLNHDLCDALIAAYTGFLHSRGRTESLGIKDEVPITVPRLA
jgi:predicted nuclease with RNAse H fold